MLSFYKYENMLYTNEFDGKLEESKVSERYAMWTNRMKSPDNHVFLLLKERKKGQEIISHSSTSV